MKGTGAKRNVFPGSCVSTGAKFPVAYEYGRPIQADQVARIVCLLTADIFIV